DDHPGPAADRDLAAVAATTATDLRPATCDGSRFAPSLYFTVHGVAEPVVAVDGLGSPEKAVLPGTTTAREA
ncbi:MAG: hypothetical protein ACRYG2_37135, partial [Janthinobacterium lividum]